MKDSAYFSCLPTPPARMAGSRSSPRATSRALSAPRISRALLIQERSGDHFAIGASPEHSRNRACSASTCSWMPSLQQNVPRQPASRHCHDNANLIARFASQGRPALLVTRVAIEHCYFHCARSILRANLWKPETWPEPRRISFSKINPLRYGGGTRSSPSHRGERRGGLHDGAVDERAGRAKPG